MVAEKAAPVPSKHSNLNEDFIAFNMEQCRGLGVLDGRASKAMRGSIVIQELVAMAAEKGYDIRLQSSRFKLKFLICSLLPFLVLHHFSNFLYPEASSLPAAPEASDWVTSVP